MKNNVTIIGAGSMAEALIAGWVKKGKIPPQSIMVTNHSNDFRLQELKDSYGIQTTRDADHLTAHGDIFLLACKPKDWRQALAPFQEKMPSGKLLVSVMAGVTTDDMAAFFPSANIPVIRTIPNTSAVVNASMTPFAIGKWVTPAQKDAVSSLFQLVGETAEVPEDTMDAMTALTGTGPAYIYYLMEAMELAAEKIGVEKTLARHLVSQTLLGAGLRVQDKEVPPAVLYQQIMSPGGTTEAGFKVLQEARLQETMIDCIERAYGRSKELGGTTNEALTGPDRDK